MRLETRFYAKDVSYQSEIATTIERLRQVFNDGFFANLDSTVTGV